MRLSAHGELNEGVCYWGKATKCRMNRTSHGTHVNQAHSLDEQAMSSVESMRRGVRLNETRPMFIVP